MESLTFDLTPVTMSSRRGRLPSLSSRLDSLSNPKRKKRCELVFCPHCDQRITVKTYNRHRRLFYNRDKPNAWRTHRVCDVLESSTSSETEGEEAPPALPLDLDLDTAECGMDDNFEDVVMTGIQSDLDTEEVSVESSVEEMWDEGESDPDDQTEKPPALPEQESTSADTTQKALTLWLVGFVLQLQSKHNIPDKALNLLFKFFHLFFSILGRFSSFMAVVASYFPSTLYSVKRKFFESQYFTRFVVCRKCWSLYHFGECININGLSRSSKECNHVQFPSHPFASGRVSCKQCLLKTIKYPSGKTIFYPFKIFCYKSLQSSLQNLLLRPGFVESCDHWKARRTYDRICDVYEGRVWKDFLEVSGQPFLSSPYSYGLMLNIDWFQPFKFSVYSVGAIYLSVMNLPRSKRFKRQNVILLGIIPGPSEPTHDMNTLLVPLVKELTKLWAGVTMTVCTGSAKVMVTVRCALLCCACDVPAGRKVCGFLGHSASRGCSKCLKCFPGTVGTMNYSGFDRATWPLRTAKGHRESVALLRKCKTKTELSQKESELGCRYSALIELPYFDAPRMLIVDPMHNLFLGSGKRMLHLWLNHSVLGNRHFQSIQESVDSFILPPDVGRIPSKILTGFSSFTADQFKNWIILFSIPSLFGILSSEHMACWRNFVLACRILCKHSLTIADINLSDALLLRFCRQVQSLYGEMAITPNMHLHAHLKEVLLDYGPVYEFWLFSYERFNGILGNQPTNNRHIEPQLMKRFLDSNSAYDLQFPDEFSEEFSPLCSTQAKVTGSILDTLSDNDIGAVDYVLPTKSTYSTFDSSDIDFLCLLLSKIRSVSPSCIKTNTVFQKYSSIAFKNKTIGQSKTRRSSLSPNIIIAKWDVGLFGQPPTRLTEPDFPGSMFRPVKVHHFAKATFSVGEKSKSLVVAVVSWYLPHPSQYVLGKPAEVWCPHMFEGSGIHSFVPIDRLASRCMHGLKNVDSETVLVIVPLVE